MILMINNEFPPVGGGSATVNLQLFRHLPKKFDEEIILLTCEAGEASGPGATDFSDVHPIKIIRIPGTSVKNLHHTSAYELIRFFFKSYFSGRDVIKNHSISCLFGWSSVPSGLAAVILGRRFNIPSIVRLSGPDLPGFEDRYRLLYPMLTPILRYVWSKASSVIAKCSYEKQEVLRHAPNSSIVVIPNGTVVQETAAPLAVLPPAGPLKVICTARLIERKGIDVLLRGVRNAVDQGVSLHLDIIGTGDGESSLKDLAASLKLDAVVTFHGYVDRKTITSLLMASHLFVLTSHQEGMSVASLEALGCGLPLILNDTGGAQDIVEQGQNGYILERNDPILLAGHFKSLARDSARLRQFGARSFAKAQSMSWEAVATRYADLFQEVAGRER